MCANTKRITNSQVIFIAKSFHLTIKGNFFCEKLFRCFGHWSELLDCFNGFHCLELVLLLSYFSLCNEDGANIDNLAGRLGNLVGRSTTAEGTACAVPQKVERFRSGLAGKLLAWLRHLARVAGSPIGPKRANRYFNIIYQ